MANLLFNVNTRKTIRTSITKIFNERESFHTFSNEKLEIYKNKLENNLVELKDLDIKIFVEKFDNVEVDQAKQNEIDKEINDSEKYKNHISECQSLIRIRIENQNPPGAVGQLLHSQHQHQVGGAAAASKLKPPTAPLPHFKSGEGENLTNFLYNFEEVLSKYNYSDFDKFQLLKSVVEGKAALLLDSLEPVKQTYIDAKELLKQALASTEVQKNNTIKQISELKLTLSGEPFRYISEVKKLITSVQQLDVKVDDFLTYFIHEGLNDQFKSSLLQITNKTRPELKDVLDNFF